MTRTSGFLARRIAVAAGVITLAGSLSACGISTTNGPHRIAKAAVPYHLLRPASPTTTTTIPPSAFSVPVTVYFIAPSRQALIATPRSVIPPGTLTSVLDVLLAGPTTLETERNISTGIPSGVRILSTSVTGPTVVVDLNSAFGQISGTTQVQAVAQVVFTVAAQLGPTVGVQFEIGGKPTPVPISSGAQFTGPVHELQYVGLTPAAPTAPATPPPSTTSTT